jgi:hypothetical protein
MKRLEQGEKMVGKMVVFTRVLHALGDILDCNAYFHAMPR